VTHKRTLFGCFVLSLVFVLGPPTALVIWLKWPRPFETREERVLRLLIEWREAPEPNYVPDFNYWGRSRSEIDVDLSNLGSDDVPALCAALKKTNNDPEIGSKIILLLRRFNDPRAIEPLIDCVRTHRGDSIPGQAIELLADMRDPRAIEVMVESLDDRYQCAYTAAIALSEFQEKRAVEPLLRMLSNADEVKQVRIIHALSHIGDKRALEPIRAFLLSDRKDVREAAESAVKELEGE
jgi:HEAT repeat protein